MMASGTRRKKLAWGLGGALVLLFGAYLVLGWALVPALVRSEAPRWLESHTGHHLQIDEVAFNPLALDLRLRGLQLRRPDDQPLLAFQELRVDLSVASLWRRALVLDAIGLDRPVLTIRLDGRGRLNWADLIDALSGPEKAAPDPARPPAPLPRIDVESLGLRQGQVDFADERKGFSSRAEDLDLELAHVSTLPDDQGRYSVSARTSAGAKLMVQAEGGLQPLALKGRMTIEGVDIARFTPYLGASPAVALGSGVLDASTDYSVRYENGQLGLDLEALQMRLQQLRVSTPQGLQVALHEARVEGGRFSLPRQSLQLQDVVLGGLSLDAGRGNGEPGGPSATLALLRLENVRLDQLTADLPAHRIALGEVALEGGRVDVRRDAAGQIDQVRAWQASLPPPARPAAPESMPWHYHVGQVRLKQWMASFADDTTRPAAVWTVQDLGARVDDVSDDLGAALAVRASFSVRDASMPPDA